MACAYSVYEGISLSDKAFAFGPIATCSDSFCRCNSHSDAAIHFIVAIHIWTYGSTPILILCFRIFVAFAIHIMHQWNLSFNKCTLESVGIGGGGLETYRLLTHYSTHVTLRYQGTFCSTEWYRYHTVPGSSRQIYSPWTCK